MTRFAKKVKALGFNDNLEDVDAVLIDSENAKVLLVECSVVTEIVMSRTGALDITYHAL